MAVKSRSVTKSKVSTAKKSSRSAAVSRKTTQPKGLKHHAKRIYRLTPKFVHGMIAGAFVGIVLVTSLGITAGADAANPPAAACIKVTDGINVNSQNANATVDLDPGCGTHKFVLKSYYAPDALGGVHGAQQVLYATTQYPVTMSGSTPATKIHVAMFDKTCFYQVDLVDISVANTGDGYPIVKAAVGGDHDCRPDQTHTYVCSLLGLTPGDNRGVTISNFAVRTVNATFTGADVSWGDGTNVPSTNVQGMTHQYSADGTYTVSVVAHFTFTGRFGAVRNESAPPCSAQVTYATPPTPETKTIFVCEIATKRTVQIDEKLLGTAQYPNDKYTTDLSKCVVTPPTTTTTTTTPPAQLANTGPGAVLIVFGLAILGGYVFHLRHRHVQRGRRHAH
jgi:hypothetical protein